MGLHSFILRVGSKEACNCRRGSATIASPLKGKESLLVCGQERPTTVSYNYLKGLVLCLLLGVSAEKAWDDEPLAFFVWQRPAFRPEERGD